MMLRIRFVALLSAVALLAAGCSAGSDSTDVGGPSGPPASENDCRQAGPSQALAKDGTFRWVWSSNPTSFDPDKITASFSELFLRPVYDTLVSTSPEGEAQPMLAKSWEISEDGKTLTMSLIDGWTYQDGTAFDAESVVANIKRSKNLSGSFNAGPLKMVTAVAAADKSTVVFTVDRGAAVLLNVLSGAAGMMMSPAVFDKPGEDVSPTGGSGAYTLTQYVPGSQAEYTARKGYWNPDAVAVDNLVIQVSADDNARLNAVQSGSADASFLRSSQYQAAKDAGLVVCNTMPQLGSYLISLNTKRSEFGDVKVRQAISYAIDREAALAVTAGLCKPTAQRFPKSYWAADPTLNPVYDPEKAKDLLAKAGLKDGFSFDWAVFSASPDLMKIAQLVQSNLAAVGITVNIIPLETASLTEQFVIKKSMDAAFTTVSAASDPSTTLAQFYLEDTLWNPGGLTSDKIQDLYEKTFEGTSKEDRAPAFAAFAQAAAEQAGPIIPVCNTTMPFVMNDTVRGMRPYVDGIPRVSGVGIVTD